MVNRHDNYISFMFPNREVSIASRMFLTNAEYAAHNLMNSIDVLYHGKLLFELQLQFTTAESLFEIYFVIFETNHNMRIISSC